MGAMSCTSRTGRPHSGRLSLRPSHICRTARFLALLLGSVVGLALPGFAAPHPGPVAAAAPSVASRSAGCGLAAAQTGMIESKTSVTGRPRTYLLQLPSHYDPSHAYPLVFVFHGAGGNARQAVAWGLQNAAGAADGGIFVFPNGVPFQNYGVGWDDGPDGHDLPFFDSMAKDVEAARCVDTSRVFVAGFSWGGDFAIALACHRGAVIRAVAANSTNDEYKDTSNYLTYTGLPCRSKQHPPVRFGHALGGDKEYPAPDFATTSKLFQYLNACAADSTPVKSSTPVMSCRTYNACASEYTECTFETRIGHTLPPNWSQDTWDFFSHLSTTNLSAG